MPLILNIETSTQICSITLSKGNQVLSCIESFENNSHASNISIFIEKVFLESSYQLTDLDAVAVSTGPGSYTGLRIGYSTAKGICYSLNIPLIEVDTLASIARAAIKLKSIDALYCPMIDARRMEVYTAIYDIDVKEILQKQAYILQQDSFGKFFDTHNIVFCGNGSSKVPQMIDHPKAIICDDILCSSKHLVPLAIKAYEEQNFSDIAYSTPFYLKSPNITKSKKRL